MEQAAYIQALQNQHATAVDTVVAEHLLWSPEVLYPLVEAIGVIRSIVMLRDGRECAVTTFSVSGATEVSQWRRAA